MPRLKIKRFWSLNKKSSYSKSRRPIGRNKLKNSDKKAIFYDMMIDMAEKEFSIPIQKDSLPEQSTDFQENTK